MNLKPSNEAPGLWINKDWQQSTPGTFAVIIGVSQYKHLEGGEDPVNETYGLGQLTVSALTGHGLFNWLSQDYRFDHSGGCPLAKCWLLLSPTPDETRVEPDINKSLTSPTFNNCELAINFWRTEMASLPESVAKKSRSLFFFSGHGLEVGLEQQILLPSDYLAPPFNNWNKAISTLNLRHGLSSIHVPQQYFFLDACRNDHRDLRAKEVEGERILTVDEAGLANPDRVTPVLYATASGQRAFSPRNPEDGMSLFGEALIEGLRGKPQLKLNCDSGYCSVDVYPLQEFVKTRVIKILQDANEPVTQIVKLSGLVENKPITFVEPRAPEMDLIVGGISGRGTISTTDPAEEVEKSLGTRFTKSQISNEPRNIWATNFSKGHELFGSEEITALWSDQVRLFSLSSGNWIDENDLVLHRVDHNDTNNIYRVVISINNFDRKGHWFQIGDLGGMNWGCILPSEENTEVRFQLEMSFDSNEQSNRRLNRLEVYLAEENEGLLGRAANLWNCYRTSHIGAAISKIEDGDLTSENELTGFKSYSQLENLLKDKVASPLAATIAASILLKANRLDLLHGEFEAGEARGWVRNLADWFEHRPDGLALWAKQLEQEVNLESLDRKVEIAHYLKLILSRGLPHTIEGMSCAAELVAVLSSSKNVDPEIQELKDLLKKALVHFRSDGLFAVYADLPMLSDPRELFGPWLQSMSQMSAST